MQAQAAWPRPHTAAGLPIALSLSSSPAFRPWGRPSVLPAIPYLPLDLGAPVVREYLGEGLEGRHRRGGALHVRIVDHDVSEHLGGVQRLVPEQNTSTTRDGDR